MDAVKYIKEKYRMCEKYPFCGDCPLRKINKEGISCEDAIKKYTEEAVSVVEKWSEEHQEITNGMKVMEVAKDAIKLANEYTVSLHFDRQWWDAPYEGE